MKNFRRPTKPHSTPLTLKWLEDNYETAEGVCIPRCTLYVHYLDFCDKNDSQPINAASFGKIIRQQFPHLTTRRLGTRGQSKYHYYGIGVKETSQYYDVTFSRKGVQTQTEAKRGNPKQMVAYSPRSKLGTLLPDFPDVKDIKLPENVPEDKVCTFLMMYRTHCQRILDTVIRANFDEVQNFLLHFWQGMPPHIVPILSTPVCVNLTGVCDSILYHAISGVLMPTVLQALPESLTQVIRKFAVQLDDWLKVALEGLPANLQSMKLDLCRRFGQILRRQTSLNHLCQASRSVLHSPEVTSQMLDDWYHIDLDSICKQTLFTMETTSDKELNSICTLYREFEQLLEDQAPLHMYTQWLDSLVYRCVTQRCRSTSCATPTSSPTNNPTSPPTTTKQARGGSSASSPRKVSRQFLLMWSSFCTRIIRDMTLHSAPSFSSFHLVHLMFDDYVLYLVETLHTQQKTRDLLDTLRGIHVPVDPEEELVLPNPSMDSPEFSGFCTNQSQSSHTTSSYVADQSHATSYCTSQSDNVACVTSSTDTSLGNAGSSFAISSHDAYPCASRGEHTSSPIGRPHSGNSQYETRLQTPDVMSLSLPNNQQPSPAVNNLTTNTAMPEQSPSSDYMYSRYSGGGGSTSHQAGEPAAPTYHYGSGYIQHNYTTRDTCDWSDYQRGYHCPATATATATAPPHAGTYYSVYPAAPLEGDTCTGTAAGSTGYYTAYEASVYTGTSDITGSGALTSGHRDVPGNTLYPSSNYGVPRNDICCYSNNNNDDLSSYRKRKSVDEEGGDYGKVSSIKRTVPAGGADALMYSALTAAGGYPRA